MQLVAEPGALTKPPLLVRDVFAYHLAEDISEFLVYFMVVFSPWAFGTTEPWSIWIMRGCGCGVGLLLLVKLAIRGIKGYLPARWAEGKAESGKSRRRKTGAIVGAQTPGSCQMRSRWVVDNAPQILAVLTLLILSYCLIAALNARAAFNPVSGTFEYCGYIRWLPNSFDRHSSWEAFWNYLALACSFWAIRDWLLGKSAYEHRAAFTSPSRQGKGPMPLVPARLQRLLWTLSVSGGLLGVEGIVQRLSNSPKLLFLLKPEIHQTAETQFASYAYRANGAQYFNLVWPVCLGFGWLIHQAERSRPVHKHLPLVCAGIMAVCPIFSGARGAALVDLGMLIASILMLLASIVRREDLPRRGKVRSTALLVLYFVGVLGLGLILGWHQLGPRMGRLRVDLDQREQLYDTARRIAHDYPLLGTGPGTFERVFQLYRSSPDAYWPAQLHNDWLEMRVTFGWIGSGLIALAFLAVCLRWFTPNGIGARGRFACFLWLSMAGCLVQARWDFPLQIYSILFLFVVWCAVLFTLSRG
jgi:hypothetical protein